MIDDAEATREANDRYFGGEPPVNYGDIGAGEAGERSTPLEPPDEGPGRYAVQIACPDRRKKIVSVWSTPAKAEQAAEQVCADLTAKGHDASEALVEVLALTPDRSSKED